MGKDFGMLKCESALSPTASCLPPPPTVPLQRVRAVKGKVVPKTAKTEVKKITQRKFGITAMHGSLSHRRQSHLDPQYFVRDTLLHSEQK